MGGWERGGGYVCVEEVKRKRGRKRKKERGREKIGHVKEKSGACCATHFYSERERERERERGRERKRGKESRRVSG